MRKQYQLISFLANLLDNQFNFFGFKFGLSAIIGLIPGLGDTVDAVLSFYIIWIGIQLKVPSPQVFRMITNVLINYAIGIIPIIGDTVYILRKVNLKNLSIIKQYLPEDIKQSSVSYAI